MAIVVNPLCTDLNTRVFVSYRNCLQGSDSSTAAIRAQQPHVSQQKRQGEKESTSTILYVIYLLFDGE